MCQRFYTFLLKYFHVYGMLLLTGGNNMLDLYKNIKKRRIELKMSQDLLAQKTGYTDRSSIAKIENGSVDLSYDKILLFSQALDIDPPDLMGYSTDLSNSSQLNDTLQLYPIEKKLILEYRKSDDYTKELVHRVLKIDEKGDSERMA